MVSGRKAVRVSTNRLNSVRLLQQFKPKQRVDPKRKDCDFVCVILAQYRFAGKLTLYMHIEGLQKVEICLKGVFWFQQIFPI